MEALRDSTIMPNRVEQMARGEVLRMMEADKIKIVAEISDIQSYAGERVAAVDANV